MAINMFMLEGFIRNIDMRERYALIKLKNLNKIYSIFAFSSELIEKIKTLNNEDIIIVIGEVNIQKNRRENKIYTTLIAKQIYTYNPLQNVPLVQQEREEIPF
ncbi:MAG: hypothetical protein QXJ06_00510 [Candidatus Aenigmatarchaeota archaeon]